VITRVKLMDTAQEVREAVDELAQMGYVKDAIFILTHDDRRTQDLAEATDTSEIGMIDEGVLTAIANLFRSQGDGLRAKMRSMGIRKRDAERFESELDKGRILLIAWGGNLNFDPAEGDPDIVYSPTDNSLNNHSV
jgi:hypothetical protein